MSYIETLGGVPTRGEAYTKLLYHLQEAQNQANVIGHLHMTEDAEMDKLLAKGWHGIAELLRLFQFKVTELAKGNLQ